MEKKQVFDPICSLEETLQVVDYEGEIPEGNTGDGDAAETEDNEAQHGEPKVDSSTLHNNSNGGGVNSFDVDNASNPFSSAADLIANFDYSLDSMDESGDEVKQREELKQAAKKRSRKTAHSRHAQTYQTSQKKQIAKLEFDMEDANQTTLPKKPKVDTEAADGTSQQVTTWNNQS